MCRDRKFKRAGKIGYTAFPPYTIHGTIKKSSPDILMDTTASEYIRHRLEKYETSIDHTRAGLQDPSGTGKLSASAPYAEQCAIPVLLDSLSGNPDEQAALIQDFARITKKLEVLARESGSNYRACLFEDVKRLAHAYHASACHASIGNLRNGAATDPCRRRLINLLLSELAEDHEVSGIEALLTMIDDNLQRSVTVPGKDAPGSHAAGHRAYATVTEPEHSTPHKDSGQIGIK